MRISIWKWLSLVSVALILVPAGAHLTEMPRKLAMAATDYFTVQQTYRGWALWGIVVAGAIISTVGLAVALRQAGQRSGLAWFAASAIIATQLVFWLVTQPANSITQNWTVVPPQWETWRMRWEIGHALSTVLTLAALLALATLLVRHDDAPRCADPGATPLGPGGGQRRAHGARR